MSSLRANSLSSAPQPPSTAQVGLGSSLVSNAFSDSSGLFSSLLDQLRGANNGFTGQVGGSGGAGGQSASVMAGLGSSWKSFLNSWSGKLGANGQPSSQRLVSSRQDVAAPSYQKLPKLADSGDGLDRAQRLRPSAQGDSTRPRPESGSGSDGCAAEIPSPRDLDLTKFRNGEPLQDAREGETVDEAPSDSSESAPAMALPQLFAEIQALLEEMQRRLGALNGEVGQSNVSTRREGDCEDNRSQEVESSDALLSQEGALTDGTSPSAEMGGLEPDARGSAAEGQASSVAPTPPEALDDAQSMLKEFLALAKSLDDKLGLSLNAKDIPANDSSRVAELGNRLAEDLTSIAESMKAVVASARHPEERSALFPPPDTFGRLANDAALSEGGNDPASDLINKALSSAERIVSQVANLSKMEEAPLSGRLSPTPVFGSSETLNALFKSFEPRGAGNGGNADSGGFGQHGGSSSGQLANAPSSSFAAPSGAEAARGSNPYSFANQLASLRSANSGLTTLFHPSEQVIVHLHRALASGDNRLSIQLNPVELGRIDIKLDVTSDGKVQGTVVASSPSTLEMLQKDSRGLERALQEAGLQADQGSLSFSLGGQQKDNLPGHTAQRDDAVSSGPARDTHPSQEGTGEGAHAEAFAETWVISPNRVNVRI